MKKTLKKIVLSGIISLASLTGCGDSENQSVKKQPIYFAAVPSQIRTGLAATKGDFDGDGNLDLVIGSINDRESKLYFLRNKGDGKFDEPKYITSVPSQIRTGLVIESGDFDNDSDLDLIVGSIHETEGRFYSFKNDGVGNFYNQ